LSDHANFKVDSVATFYLWRMKGSKSTMTNKLFLRCFCRLHNLRRNVKGQDLIEYALMAGFVAVAAGAIMPGVSSSISTIFSKLAGQLSTLAMQP